MHCAQYSSIESGGSVKLRKHSRFAVQLPAVYTAENIQSKGVVFNLSAEGCAIEAARSCPRGPILRCRSLFRIRRARRLRWNWELCGGQPSDSSE